MNEPLTVEVVIRLSEELVEDSADGRNDAHLGRMLRELAERKLRRIHDESGADHYLQLYNQQVGE